MDLLLQYLNIISERYRSCPLKHFYERQNSLL